MGIRRPACLAAGLLIASLTLLAAPQAHGPAPPRIQASDPIIRLDLVGRMPTKINPTSPVVAGSRLLLIDQGGAIYSWDGTRASTILTAATRPAGIKLSEREPVQNVAANSAGTKVYVMFTSATLPKNIPSRDSPLFDADGWHLLYEYDFDGSALTNGRAVTALKVRTDGHTGGGLAVMRDGSVLFAEGDNGDSYEDGRSYSQDPSLHLAKLMRIDPVSGQATVAALGVRCAQRLTIDGAGDDARLNFADPGGWISEEVNSVPISALSIGAPPLDFGWGRHAADKKSREGTFYIDTLGESLGRIPSAEAGFIEPFAEFGREEAGAVAVSGPVTSAQSFKRITALFGDLVSGGVYATTQPLTVTRQSVFRVTLQDASGQTLTLKSFTNGQRPDPRFFNFPDGTAGLLVEATGDFYRVTEKVSTIYIPG